MQQSAGEAYSERRDFKADPLGSLEADDELKLG
jgi:hypothetical protein